MGKPGEGVSGNHYGTWFKNNIALKHSCQILESSHFGYYSTATNDLAYHSRILKRYTQQ